MKKKIITLEEALAAGRQDTVRRYADYINPEIARLLSLLGLDRKFARAEGAHVFDAEGNCFTDLLGGFGSLNLGHNHPEICDAFGRVDGIPNILQVSMGSLAAALAETLAVITPGRLARTFFCSSGAEAVEAALKLARIATGRTKLLSLSQQLPSPYVMRVSFIFRLPALHKIRA